MEETIQRFRKGDPKAFEKLFWDFFPSGQRFVRTFQVSEELGDDILQEVFIGIWNNRLSILNEAHFKSYFYKSIRNNTIKRLTRQKNPLTLDNIPNEEGEDLFTHISQIEFNREVSRAIALLPEKRRIIILMSMKGMSAEQISDALNISVNTIKSQKNKAYTFLRKELKNIDSFLFYLLF